MKKSIISFAAALAAAILTLVGCDKEVVPVNPGQDAVVAVFKNGNIDYWRQIATTVKSECEARGVKPIISYVNDDSDADGQLAIVAGLRELKSYYNIKGVIIAPIFTKDDHRVEKALANFAGNDIPVIIVDSPIDSDVSPLKDTYKAYVGTDNAAAGAQLAKVCGIKDASSILAARVAASTPTVARYDAFCKEIGATVPIWETIDLDTPENLKAQLEKHPGATNLVFFNGNLCNSVKAAFDGVDVYTFDVYEQFLLDLKNPATSPIKGIIAQNTFEMGHQAVNAIFSTTAEKNIYTPTIYITSDNLYSSEVKPFLDYYNIREDAKGTVLMLLGSESEFWNRVAEGAAASAEKNNFNIEVVYRETETKFQTLLDAIENLDNYKNLKGIVMAENDMTIDAAIAAKNPKVPIVAIEALPSAASPLKFSSCVVADNFGMGKEIAKLAGGENVLVMSYDNGGSLDRAEGVFVYFDGNVGRIASTGSVDAEEDLRAFLAANPGFYGTAIITTGNFITDGIMSQLSGMNVCAVDMNDNARKYLRSGAISFIADPDLYEMGYKAVECVSNDISDYHVHNVAVNYIYPEMKTTLSNVKKSMSKGGDRQPFTFEYDFSYVDGRFHHSDYTENILGMISNSTIYLDGDKVLDEDGDIVCKDLTFTPDGFISYLESPNYGKYSITYSGRHISSIRMEDFKNSDGLSVSRIDNFNWKNNVLESIVKETSIDGETSGVETVSFSYGDVPNPDRQFSGIMTLCQHFLPVKRLLYGKVVYR